MTRARAELAKSAEHLLAELADRKMHHAARRRSAIRERETDIAALAAADLVVRLANGAVEVTSVGLAHLARSTIARANGPVDPFRAQHLEIAQRTLDIAKGTATIDDAESPLAWLARRKGRDGRLLIAPVQLQAGERLRAEFTRAQLMPRTTSNWSATVADGRRGGGQPATFTEAVIAARQRVRHALDAVGPEFSGLLLDVCCFLKGLADVERERGWPPRSAKVVLQLGLDRLARHYGLGAEARGRARVPVRTWLAPETTFVVGD
jgi:hypothetical protein